MIGRIAICCLLFSLNAAGQKQDSIADGRSQAGAHGLVGWLHKAQQYLDDKTRAKVDPHYIEVPDKPWRVVARYNENMVEVDYDNSMDVLDGNTSLDWKLRFQPPHASSVGFWVGYRGTGVAFSQPLSKNAGRYFSFSTTGAKYGFNFRLRRFNTSAATLDAATYKNGVSVYEAQVTDNMPSPVWIRSTYVNGYYVFNGHRYSQAAAYNQSVIQRRSAGSLLAGATWFQSSLDYSDDENSLFMIFGNGIGRIKVHQANLGLGYGYNWVPLRGLVINVMAMPTVSVYNRVKVYKYDSNYAFSLSQTTADDFGQWDPATKTWANGQTYKPIPMTESEDDVLTDLDSWESDAETVYSWLRFNLDLRLGIAYNWRNCFIGLQAQYNNFNYKQDKCKVNIFDAYARLSLGVRL